MYQTIIILQKLMKAWVKYVLLRQIEENKYIAREQLMSKVDNLDVIVVKMEVNTQQYVEGMVP